MTIHDRKGAPVRQAAQPSIQARHGRRAGSDIHTQPPAKGNLGQQSQQQTPRAGADIQQTQRRVMRGQFAKNSFHQRLAIRARRQCVLVQTQIQCPKRAAAQDAIDRFMSQAAIHQTRDALLLRFTQ